MTAYRTQKAGEPQALLSPVDRARLLAAFVDELIPGDDEWPSASQAGVHGIIALRVCADWSDAEMMRLADAVGWDNGAFLGSGPEERAALVKRFEAAEPGFFDNLHTATVLAYYETPFAVEVIRRSGRPYSIRPHATGYPMTSFDVDRDRPTHNRGHYLKTEDVRPVDISSLDLDTVNTERWGLER